MGRPWSVYLSGNKNMLFSLISLFIVDASLFSLTLLFGSILGSPATLAISTSAVSGASVTVQVACTLNGIGMNTHNAEIPNGTYRADIGTTTLKALCNDDEGFAIYAAGYTGDTIGDTNSNKLVGTTSSGSAVINTGLATSAGNPDTSNWAMKLTLGTDSGDTTDTNALAIDSDTEGPFSTYHTVPNEYTKVAHKNSATSMDETTGGATITSTYAAYISKAQATGGYAGQVIYTLVHPASESAPVACNPSGTTIGTNTSTDIQCMQDFALLSSSTKNSLLSSMVTGTQYTLMDKRDEKTYTVSKLADGKVWMTQNLDLDIDSNTTYTNLDTDLGWNGTSYSTANWAPMRSTYTTTAVQTHEWCVGGVFDDVYCAYNNTPESYDPGDLYWNGALSDWTDWNEYFNSCDRSFNPPSCDASLNPLPTYTAISGSPTQQYHLGNYYNWAASIASNDASLYGVYNSVTGKYENLEANQSICPAGWRLPYAIKNSSTDQAEGDFVDLWTEYGWNSATNSFNNHPNDLIDAPLYFVQSGDFFGNIGYIGYASGFQASVAYNDTLAYGAGPYLYNAYPSDTGGRDDAFSIRCLLR